MFWAELENPWNPKWAVYICHLQVGMINPTPEVCCAFVRPSEMSTQNARLIDPFLGWMHRNGMIHITFGIIRLTILLWLKTSVFDTSSCDDPLGLGLVLGGKSYCTVIVIYKGTIISAKDSWWGVLKATSGSIRKPKFKNYYYPTSMKHHAAKGYRWRVCQYL